MTNDEISAALTSTIEGLYQLRDHLVGHEVLEVGLAITSLKWARCHVEARSLELMLNEKEEAGESNDGQAS